jgi:hypothetical protein
MGLSIGKTRRGSLSFVARCVTKAAASDRVLDTIACKLSEASSKVLENTVSVILISVSL